MSKTEAIHGIITTWKLNRPELARRCDMPVTTFKNKLDPKQPAYWFTDAEIERLLVVLRELAGEIGSI